MSYTPTTDFVALIRQLATGAEVAQMPGLDFVVAALSRAGLFTLWTGQDAPTVNVASTAWLKPSSPSWVAEGAVYLYNAETAAFELATSDLWATFLLSAVSGSAFQSISAITGNIDASTTLLAVQRSNPAATTLRLPSVGARGNVPLQIVDWSDPVTAHAITLTPKGTETIMRRGSFLIFSTTDQLAGVTLYPSTDLNGWVIAP